MSTSNGEIRQALLRAMALHEEDRSHPGSVFEVRCGCGQSMPGVAFTDRKQALRQHQADEYLATLTGRTEGSDGR